MPDLNNLSLTFLILLLCLCSCVQDEKLPEETSQPVPEYIPQAVVQGDVDYGEMTLSDLKGIEGCTCLAWAEDQQEDEDGIDYLIGFNLNEPVMAEMKLGGEMRTLALIEKLSLKGDYSGTYIHGDARYRVVTELVHEERVSPELETLSGVVSVEDFETGDTLRVLVIGECGC